MRRFFRRRPPRDPRGDNVTQLPGTGAGRLPRPRPYLSTFQQAPREPLESSLPPEMEWAMPTCKGWCSFEEMIVDVLHNIMQEKIIPTGVFIGLIDDVNGSTFIFRRKVSARRIYDLLEEYAAVVERDGPDEPPEKDRETCLSGCHTQTLRPTKC